MSRAVLEPEAESLNLGTGGEPRHAAMLGLRPGEMATSPGPRLYKAMKDMAGVRAWFSITWLRTFHLADDSKKSDKKVIRRPLVACRGCLVKQY
jgi:hypothetical protein